MIRPASFMNLTAHSLRDVSPKAEVSVTPFPGATQFVPQTTSLDRLRAAAQACRGCDLYKYATQAILGKGPKAARMVLVGEQPGDQEDRQGQPFVGPAGKLLDKALIEAGIDRAAVYVTNAVKHFKFEQRGKKRLHARPSARETTACRPWLDAELRVIEPSLIVLMGATAAQSLMGSKFKLTRQRGSIIRTDSGWNCLATYHPSALLRSLAHDGYEELWRDFVADLKTAGQWAKAHAG